MPLKAVLRVMRLTAVLRFSRAGDGDVCHARRLPKHALGKRVPRSLAAPSQQAGVVRDSNAPHRSTQFPIPSLTSTPTPMMVNTIFLGTTIATPNPTSTPDYPSEANAFYAVHETSVGGTEQEGNAAIFVPDTTRVLYARNTGTTVAPIGSRVIVSDEGDGFVFRWDLPNV
jgi:hypothetical protein